MSNKSKLSADASTANRSSATSRDWVFGLVLIFAGGLLRVICSWNDLWLDEIISIDLASQISGWQGILTEFLYDNNHYLNTAWVYPLGPDREPIWYRAPSVLAGVAVIPVVYWVLKPYGRFSQISAAILFSLSYVQIHYSSEARGYAFQLLFAVAAFGFMDRYHRNNKTSMAIGFGICASLALLSHLLTINFLLACGFWSISFQSRQKLPPAKQIWRIAACLGLPLLTGALLYLTNVKHLQFGGGPKYDTLLILTGSWSLLLGVVTPGWVRVFCGVAAILLTAFTLRIHWNREEQAEQSSQSWKFLLLFLLLIPLLRIMIPGTLLYTRYFLLQIAFALMLLCIVGGYFLETSSAVQKAKLKNSFYLAIGLVVLLNLYSCIRLATHGRGDYRESLQAMTSEAGAQPTTIGLTNEILDGPIIKFFRSTKSLENRQIQISPLEDQPDWIIVNKIINNAAWHEPIADSIDNFGTNYELQFVHETSYLSGFQWNCYKRQP